MSDGENLNPNQQTNAVKLRDRNSKKKKVFRDFKPRISLPPDMKNNFLHRTASAHQSSSSDERHLPLKASESSRPFPSNSLSVQALDRSLNQSSSSLFAHLSRTEQRRSMLDLGWGKIESYIKLEKLGEGFSFSFIFQTNKNFLLFFPLHTGTYANVFKGTSNLRTGFVALKEIRLEQEEGKSNRSSLFLHLFFFSSRCTLYSSTRSESIKRTETQQYCQSVRYHLRQNDVNSRF